MTQPFWRDVVLINADRSCGVGRPPNKVGAFAVASVLLIACLAAAGCASHQPTRASFTQIATFDRAPKPPGCSMPILSAEPLANHRRIAIVEGWGDFDKEDAVLEALRGQGCETGADALVIVESQSQTNPAIAKAGLPETLQAEEMKTDATQAQRHKAEITPGVGEFGHPGYYVDSVAIVYEKEKGDSALGH